MDKGIKKIAWTGEGTVYNGSKGSIPGQLLVVAPDQFIWFQIGEWFPATTPQDKAKEVKWAIFNNKGYIDHQRTVSSTSKYAYKIPKRLCGPYTWYVEASLSGNFDGKSGLKMRGETPAKLTDSRWSRTEGGADVRQSYQFSYGELVWLRLFTEGLNGYDNVEVRVYRKLRAAFGLLPKDDEETRKIYFVKVINGEINLKIPNTYSWYQSMSDRSGVEEFYVRVVHPATGKFIEDNNGDNVHARFLRIKDNVVSQVTDLPQNRTPVTIYQPDKNAARFELCKFEQINVIEDGKPHLIFDNGNGVKNIQDKREKVIESIIFNFDSTELSADSLKKLNNILQFLLEHRHSSIQLDGFACVIGKQNHNNILSENRAKTVKEFFSRGKLDPSRITTAGHGEVNPTDDKKGRDNIKFKNEQEYIQNRRVDIGFDYLGHNAETIIYETILGSTPKNITVKPEKFDTRACFERTKHTKKVKVTNINLKSEGDGSITIPAVSAIEKTNPLPFQYIWPRNKILDTRTSSSANDYFVHIHSCRYYSVENNPTVVVKVYPDIKWDFHFFLNLSNQLSVKWQNLTPAQHTEMQKKAGKIGAEKRWSQTEVDFGVIMEVNWDKSGTTYGSKLDVTLKHEQKIKWLYSLFGSLKEFSKAVTDTTKGKLTKTRLGRALPFKLELQPPNFCLGAEWMLEKGEKKGKPTDEIGTSVKFYFNAKPLIGATLNIDLLSMAVTAAGTAVGNPEAGQIFNEVRDWLAEDGHNITFKMYIDLLITGTLQGSADINFNTASDKKNMNATLTGTLSAELQAALEVEGKIVTIGVQAYVKGEMKATGKAAITFGHGLKYDNTGMSYRPQLMFEGLVVTFVIKADVGLSIKRGIFKGKKEMPLANFEKKATLIPEFDVIKNLEKYAGVSANIPLFKES
ncbi:OmpA family protein [Mucilaginibacter sp. CAU 1740]|uniref:OmpA family protein n=1 Tax=Mucilaginibacter sp. CAU 1740 TaxID=3140365 RepID=UPI00325B7746